MNITRINTMSRTVSTTITAIAYEGGDPVLFPVAVSMVTIKSINAI